MHKYQALEKDYKQAQEVIQQLKQQALDNLEGGREKESEKVKQATLKYNEEKQNNRALLKELNKAHQTIGQLKGYLEKQTNRVVTNHKKDKEK